MPTISRREYTRDIDIETIDRMVDIYVNEEMLKRVHERIASDLRRGRSAWPFRTGRSQYGFLGEVGGIDNREEYAEFVEERYGAVDEYVNDHWVDYVEDDFDATDRRT